MCGIIRRNKRSGGGWEQRNACPWVPSEGAPKGGAVLFSKQNIQQFCELCRGRDWHERKNYVRRTMHILHVISSVYRSSKCTKIVGGWGFAPDPTAFPHTFQLSLSGPTYKALTSKGRQGRRWKGKSRRTVEGRGAKMIYAPGARNPHAATGYINVKFSCRNNVFLRAIP